MELKVLVNVKKFPGFMSTPILMLCILGVKETF